MSFFGFITRFFEKKDSELHLKNIQDSDDGRMPSDRVSNDNVIGLMTDVNDDKELIKYPPFNSGIPVYKSEKMLSSQKMLIEEIRSKLAISDMEFDHYYLPIIASYGDFVNLLPASQDHHHRAAGGLFQHGLEVMKNALHLADQYRFSSDETPEKRKKLIDKWFLAIAVAAVCHDIGKPVTDVEIRCLDNPENIWNPFLYSLVEWAEQTKVKRYTIRWYPGRHKNHESLAPVIMNKIISQEIMAFISRPDPYILNQMMDSIAVRNVISGDNKIYKIVSESDEYSVSKNLESVRSLGEIQAGSTALSIEKIYVNAFKFLFDAKEITIQKEAVQARSDAFVINGALFIMWPFFAKNLARRIKSQNFNGVPLDSDSIVSILQDRDFIQRRIDSPSSTASLWLIREEIIEKDVACYRFSNTIKFPNAEIITPTFGQDSQAIVCDEEEINHYYKFKNKQLDSKTSVFEKKVFDDFVVDQNQKKSGVTVTDEQFDADPKNQDLQTPNNNHSKTNAIKDTEEDNEQNRSASKLENKDQSDRGYENDYASEAQPERKSKSTEESLVVLIAEMEVCGDVSGIYAVVALNHAINNGLSNLNFIEEPIKGPQKPNSKGKNVLINIKTIAELTGRRPVEILEELKKDGMVVFPEGGMGKPPVHDRLGHKFVLFNDELNEFLAQAIELLKFADLKKIKALQKNGMADENSDVPLHENTKHEEASVSTANKPETRIEDKLIYSNDVVPVIEKEQPKGSESTTFNLSQQPKTAQESKPAQPVKPVQQPKTAQESKPAQPVKPVQQPKTAQESKPAQPVKPVQQPKAAQESKPAQPVKPVQQPKTAQESKPVQPVSSDLDRDTDSSSNSIDSKKIKIDAEAIDMDVSFEQMHHNQVKKRVTLYDEFVEFINSLDDMSLRTINILDNNGLVVAYKSSFLMPKIRNSNLRKKIKETLFGFSKKGDVLVKDLIKELDVESE